MKEEAETDTEVKDGVKSLRVSFLLALSCFLFSQ